MKKSATFNAVGHRPILYTRPDKSLTTLCLADYLQQIGLL